MKLTKTVHIFGYTSHHVTHKDFPNHLACHFPESLSVVCVKPHHQKPKLPKTLARNTTCPNLPRSVKRLLSFLVCVCGGGGGGGGREGTCSDGHSPSCPGHRQWQLLWAHWWFAARWDQRWFQHLSWLDAGSRWSRLAQSQQHLSQSAK